MEHAGSSESRSGSVGGRGIKQAPAAGVPGRSYVILTEHCQQGILTVKIHIKL